MAPKIEKPEDCRSGSDFYQFAQSQEDQGVEIVPNGSYWEVRTKKGRAYIPHSDRALAKPSRNLIVMAFKAIGLAAVVLTILWANGLL